MKLQTIYEYLKDYGTKEEIDEILKELFAEELLLIRKRYGFDLEKPNPSCKLTKEENQLFYGCLIPKIRRLLKKRSNMKKSESISEQVDDTKTDDNLDLNTSNDKLEVKENVSVDQKLLLEMIKEGKTNNEMCSLLNISMQQLSSELLKLKNYGITMSRKYYSDGTIKYTPISRISDLKENKRLGMTETIITDTKEDNIKVLVISDLHFCNKLERIDLINRAFNYCAKNGINIILCSGDFLDGKYTKGEQSVSDLYKQAEYFTKNYPYDKNILTFGVAGDHDMSLLNRANVDITELCNNYRHDVVIAGYGNSLIFLKNDIVQLFHHIDGGSLTKADAPIILHGHSHKFAAGMDNNGLDIAVPTLSNVVQPMPTALELNLSFDRGYIKECTIKQVYFGELDITLNELRYDLLKHRTVNYGPIENIESYRNPSSAEVKKRILSLPQNQASNGVLSKEELSSQIDKFNKKWKL